MHAEHAVVIGMRKAARFGHTAVQHTYTRTRDPFKIRASGSYGQAFITQNIPDGALLANAMHYAVFVERGRKPGKPPPLDPIVEWVYQKRLSARPKPLTRPRRPSARKRAASKPSPPREPGAVPDRAPGVDPDGANGTPAKAGPPKPRKRYTKAERAERRMARRKRKVARIRKERARKRALKKRVMAHERAKQAAIGIAMGVRWKIARYGTKGRWVVRRTMPKIAKRASREIRQELQRLNNRPPRG